MHIGTSCSLQRAFTRSAKIEHGQVKHISVHIWEPCCPELYRYQKDEQLFSATFPKLCCIHILWELSQLHPLFGVYWLLLQTTHNHSATFCCLFRYSDLVPCPRKALSFRLLFSLARLIMHSWNFEVFIMSFCQKRNVSSLWQVLLHVDKTVFLIGNSLWVRWS